MKKHAKGLIFLGITIILFSTFEVCGKLIGARLHPLQISFFRFLSGGIVLLPAALFLMKRKGIRVGRSFWQAMFILGLVNVVISMTLIQYSLKYLDASLTALVFSSNPLFVTLFASPLLSEKITARKVGAIVAALSGVLVLCYTDIDLASSSLKGLPLVLGSAIIFALYTVLGKRLTLSGTDPLVMTAFSFLTGSIMLVPIMLTLHIPLYTDDSTLFLPILYLGIFVSGIAYMCYFYGLANMHTGSGTLVYFIKPVLASVLAVVFLGEQLNANFYAGSLIIFLSLVAGNIEILRNLFSAQKEKLD